MVEDDFRGHRQSPRTPCTLDLTGPGIQTEVPVGAISVQRRSNSTLGIRRSILFHRATALEAESADLI